MVAAQDSSAHDSFVAKVLVIDDHALIRDALRGVLKELDNRTTVLEAFDGRQAMRLIGEHADLDVILLDLNLPDRSGLSMLAELRKGYPEVSIVVLSAFNDRDNIVSALELGALGFIPKSAPREVMLGALRLVFAGGTYIPPDIFKPQEPAPAWPARGRATDGSSPSPGDLGLTDRQLDVLARMMRGMSNKTICRELDLAEPTVKKHVTAIFKALKVTNRTEAAITAGALGWNLPRLGE
jgi:DNA-binding NarL/FixJ family response regulator